MNHKLLIGDCKDTLKTIHNNSIDLVVTSPPYNVGKDYGVFKENLRLRDYEEFTHNWLYEIFRILKPTGKFALNVSSTDKNHIDELHCIIAKDMGFKIREKINWIKTTPTKSRYLISQSNKSYFNRFGKLAMTYEPIIIFQKQALNTNTFVNKDVPECWRYNTWFIAPVRPRENHPAPFPEEIPKRLITLYTKEGNTILDPFSGTGTTMKVASDLKRNSIGCELSQEYAGYTKERLGISIDIQDLTKFQESKTPRIKLNKITPEMFSSLSNELKGGIKNGN